MRYACSHERERDLLRLCQQRIDWLETSGGKRESMEGGVDNARNVSSKSASLPAAAREGCTSRRNADAALWRSPNDNAGALVAEDQTCRND
jgi:hypothetical protein